MRPACLVLLLPALFAAPSLTALLSTMASEAAVVWLLARLFGFEAGAAMFASAFINAVTQPLLYASMLRLPGFGGPDWWLWQLGAELVVCLAESGLWAVALSRRGASTRRILLFGWVPNLFSTLLGLLFPF